MMELSQRRCVVVGAGASGLSAAALLLRRGAQVTINDGRSRAALGTRAVEAEELGADLSLGGHRESDFAEASLVVLSPGVPPLPVVAKARDRGVEIIGEVELAARCLTAPVVGITGTNGKSTVTTLVGEMLKRTGFATFVGGNLGEALSKSVGTAADRPEGRVVVELSSFQLEHVERLRPRVAALLNVSPDHLDRYEDFEHYARTKGRIFGAQSVDDHAVFPADAPACAALVPSPGPTRHAFGGEQGVVRRRGDRLVDEVSGTSVRVDELRLRGRHNELNAAAAMLIARLAGASPEGVVSTLQEVDGLPHRAAFVRELDGVRYVDDSKATNVGAAVAALDGLATGGRRAVLIAGGVDKGGSYAPLSERMARVGRGAVLIGEAAPLLEQALAPTGLPIVRATTMQDAVDQARALAEPGDLVLLAPACSSYDMYRSYAARGDDFVACVRSLDAQGEAE